MSSGSSSFPSDWPANCPPADSVGASITVYRTVRTNPPTENDFLSYREQGKKVSKQKECQACGLSVWPTREDAAHQREVFNWENPHIAEATLTPAYGKVKSTPSRSFPEHLTWWSCQSPADRLQIFSIMQE